MTTDFVAHMILMKSHDISLSHDLSIVSTWVVLLGEAFINVDSWKVSDLINGLKTYYIALWAQPYVTNQKKKKQLGF